MSIPQRRSERGEPSKGDRREQALVAAGEQMLVDGSFEAASVADLAGEAGLSRASFYFYFASKQALLSAVIAAAVTDLEARLSGPLTERSDQTPADLVTETVRAATDLWWDHRIVLLASVELGVQLPEVYDRNLESMREVSRATVALLRDAGLTDDLASERLVTALVLMTERNFYDLARQHRPRGDYDELADLLATIWLRALDLTP